MADDVESLSGESSESYEECFGIAVMEVFNIMYLGDEVIEPEKQLGTVTIEHVHGTQYLYKVDHLDTMSRPLINQGDPVMVTVEAPLPFLDEFDISFDLFCGAYKSDISIAWENVYSDGVTVGERRITSPDYNGDIRFQYGLFTNASVANLELKLINKPGSAQVYGFVAASNSRLDHSSLASILFWKRSEDKIQVREDGVIPFSKSRVGVPLDSELFVCVTVNVDGKDCGASFTLDPKYKGETDILYDGHFKSLDPKYKEETDILYDGHFKLEVTWDVKVDTIKSTYREHLHCAPELKLGEKRRDLMVRVGSFSGPYYFYVPYELAVRIPLLKNRIENGSAFLPISPDVLQVISFYFTQQSSVPRIIFFRQQDSDSSGDPQFVLKVEIVGECKMQMIANCVDLFNLIQAAHKFKIASLMDYTCAKLADYAKDEVRFTDMYSPRKAFWIASHEVFNRRLRSHQKTTFINISEFVDVYYYPLLGYQKKMEELFIMKENPVFEYFVNSFMEFSDFGVNGDYFKNTKELYQCVDQDLEHCSQLSEDIDSSSHDRFTKLNHILILINDRIRKDLGLARSLDTGVFSRLVQVLKNIDLIDIQFWALCILSRANLSRCGDVIKETVPDLLKHICSLRSNELVTEAAITLTRIANVYPNVITVSQLQSLRGPVEKSTCEGCGVLDYLAMFFVIVCREDGLLFKQKSKVVLPILCELVKKSIDFCYTHVVRACYALSYLSYGRRLAIRTRICQRLVVLSSHTSSSVVGPALGVLGNIVRWGYGSQLTCLVVKCNLLQCLKENILCSRTKKIRMEGCQIIANIAARRGAIINDIIHAGLLDSLCNLLKEDESDVKMEAAWAIIYILPIDMDKYKHVNLY